MRRNNKQVTTYFILFSLLLIGVVYAILQANLQINGTAKIQANTWDIHFDNIQVNANSVPIGTGDSAATIDLENNCKVDFEVTLSIPGDFYEFTIDVVNAGTIDGMIGELNKTLKVNNEVVSETPNYLNYSVTYSDGMEIQANHKLEAGVTETYKVRLEFKTDIEELPEATTITTSLEPQYVQADSSAIPKPELFADGTWSQIVDTYNSGAISSLQTAMEAGTTREVQLDMNNDGTAETTAHVRIANLSTPAECSTTGFSQTACGFVIEFSDVITTHVMNSTNTNVGGWPASSMRTYVNSDIYNTLPTELKSKIIETTVVSGHGSNSGETNFTSTDRMYLLSTKEVWGKAGTSNIINYDTAETETRQLDYYSYKNVTTSSYSGAIKKNLSGSASIWWLRSATSTDTSNFFYMYSSGDWKRSNANAMYGVSPAFRIAE
jgi:hypothetical protein